MLASADAVEFAIADGLLGLSAFSTVAPTMKKGERCTLAVQPAYGYGLESSSRADVPPGTALSIDVTLLAVKKVERVYPDGTVVKKTLVEAPPDVWDRPNEGATVTLVGEVRLADGGAVLQRWPEDAPLVFVTDEEQAPTPGLEAAVCKVGTFFATFLDSRHSSRPLVSFFCRARSTVLEEGFFYDGK